MEPQIVHVSADYPDSMVSEKTAVIRRLVEHTSGFGQRIYSLNRINGLAGSVTLPSGKNCLAIGYKAPPKGFMLQTRLKAVADLIANDLRSHGCVPDIFHAHKLTVEGLVVSELAATFGKPYVVSIQGDTDLKILSVRRDLATTYRRILEQASGIFSLAPWSRSAVADRTGIPADRIDLLPCLTQDDTLNAASPVGLPKFAAVFHLLSARRKNLSGLAKAAGIAARELPGLAIDIYGGGTPADVMAAQHMIDAAGAGRIVRLCGPLEHGRSRAVLQNYAALVVPTLRESYGLVHVEALFAGLPIMWSRHRGVDGLLDPTVAGYCCDPARPEDIARGLVVLAEKEGHLKAGIARAQATGAFDHLRHPAILSRYAVHLDRVLRSSRSGQASHI